MTGRSRAFSSSCCFFLPDRLLLLLPFPEPLTIDLDHLKQPPSSAHPFGTDSKGRDVLSRVLHGGVISISVALVAAAVSRCIGFSVGLVSGYFGGKTDTVLMALVDFSCPSRRFSLAVAISVVLPPVSTSVMIALSVVGWTSFARFGSGAMSLTLKESSFVEAARAGGLRTHEGPCPSHCAAVPALLCPG